MGHNNLVLVPGYGPKIRFRAVWADLDCPEEPSPEGEDPCAGCEEYCTRACPMDAFSTGTYSREQCLARTDRPLPGLRTRLPRRGRSVDNPAMLQGPLKRRA